MKSCGSSCALPQRQKARFTHSGELSQEFLHLSEVLLGCQCFAFIIDSTREAVRQSKQVGEGCVAHGALLDLADLTQQVAAFAEGHRRSAGHLVFAIQNTLRHEFTERAVPLPPFRSFSAQNLRKRLALIMTRRYIARSREPEVVAVFDRDWPSQ